MTFVAQPFDRRDDDDDWKKNRDDGNDSESDVSTDDEDKPKKKVMFVRCVNCRDKKIACAECKKRRNCEASERHRQKNKRTKAALKRLKKVNNALQAKLQVYRENDEVVRSLITSGAIYCRGCCGQLANLPAAHVAPSQPLPSATAQPVWNVATHPQQSQQVMPNNSAHGHHQVGLPMPEGSMDPLQNVDPTFGAGALDIDLDDIGFWLNENDSGN